MERIKRTNEEYIKLLAVLNPTIVMLDEYKNDKTHIRHQCMMCGHMWTPAPHDVLNGSGCPNCRYIMEKEKYIAKLALAHPTIILVDKYVNMSTKVTHKCLIDGYEWVETPTRVLLTKKCPVCSDKKIGPAPEYKNSIWALKDKSHYEAFMTEEQMKEYMPYSSRKIDMICPYCGRHKNRSPAKLYAQGLGCICSDGISYPNKIIWNILEQLNVNIQREYSPDWARGKIYDIYIPSLNCIVENHGLQHYEHTTGKIFDDLRTIQSNDAYKKEMALLHGIEHYVILDCKKSNVGWIRQSVKNSELPILLRFDINAIDWTKASLFASTSLMRKAADMYTQSCSIKNISTYFGVSKETVRRWLRHMTEVGMCDYDSKTENLKAHSKSVRCVELNICYQSMAEAARAFGVTKDAIHHCIKSGPEHTCAGHHWELVTQQSD